MKLDDIFASLKAGSDGAAAGLSQLKGGFDTVSSTISQVVGTIQGLVSQMASFVAPLDPGLVAMLDMVMRDLTATIGRAFAPVLDASISALRLLADTLTPIISALMPTMKQLSGIVEAVSQSMATEFKALAEALEPLISVVLGIVQVIAGVYMTALNLMTFALNALSPIIAAVGAVLEVLITPFRMLANLFTDFSRLLSIFASGIKEMFSIGAAVANVKGVLGSVTDAFRNVAGTVFRLAAILAGWAAKMLGLTSFLDGMIKGAKGAEKTGDSTGAAVPKSAQMTTIEGFGKSVATAAFTAGQSERAESQLDVLKDIYKDLQDIRSGTKDLGKIISNAILSATKHTATTVASEIPKRTGQVLDSGVEMIAGAGMWLGIL